MKRLSLTKAESLDREYHGTVTNKKPSLNGETAPVTELLRQWNQEGAEGAGQVMESLYLELHRIAKRALLSERPGHTLQPTALVHELYLRLRQANVPEWHDRAHFFAIAASTIRRILIDHARAHSAERRGGGQIKVPLEFAEAGHTCSYDDLLIIDQALSQLEQADPRAAKVAELRFFAGLQESEVAEQLGVSSITVKRDWKFARAWLAAYLASSK